MTDTSSFDLVPAIVFLPQKIKPDAVMRRKRHQRPSVYSSSKIENVSDHTHTHKLSPELFLKTPFRKWIGKVSPHRIVRLKRLLNGYPFPAPIKQVETAKAGKKQKHARR